MTEWIVLVLVAMLIFAYPVGCFVVAVACASSRRRRDPAPGVLGLTWDAGRGQYCHAETGPLTIPADYGTVITAAERMWIGLP